MALSKRQINELLRTIGLTKAAELTCDECLDSMAEFAEQSLRGKSVPESLRAVEHHLEICGECLEEYQALLSALPELDNGAK